MAKNKELNTSCRATFKDGSVQEFESIEEAAEATGLTVAAIKIRCNRPGCVGKDKTAFEWLDEHTKEVTRLKNLNLKAVLWSIK